MLLKIGVRGTLPLRAVRDGRRDVRAVRTLRPDDVASAGAARARRGTLDGWTGVRAVKTRAAVSGVALTRRGRRARVRGGQGQAAVGQVSGRSWRGRRRVVSG